MLRISQTSCWRFHKHYVIPDTEHHTSGFEIPQDSPEHSCWKLHKHFVRSETRNPCIQRRSSSSWPNKPQHNLPHASCYSRNAKTQTLSFESRQDKPDTACYRHSLMTHAPTCETSQESSRTWCWESPGGSPQPHAEKWQAYCHCTNTETRTSSLEALQDSPEHDAKDFATSCPSR